MSVNKSRSIRVALYFYRLGNVGGGAERMLCALANALCERGFSVHVITWDDEDAQTFYPLDRRVIWCRLGFRPVLTDKLRRTRALADTLRRHKTNVLIGFVMSGDKTVYAAARLASVRLVAAERNGPSIYRLRYGALQRWTSFAVLHFTDRIAVQFAAYTEGYPASLRRRIVVIPNPVETATQLASPDQPDDHGRYTLLTVTRLDIVQKRIEILIRAFARIAANHPTWDLRIIGDGPEKGALQNLVTELEISGRVFFESSTPDVFAAYAQAHLFVLPSLWEGFPNALSEALSHGLPGVGFGGAEGVSHLVKDGDTGWLAGGVDDVVSLASALNGAMADGAERARRGACAAKSMVCYAPDVQFDRWAALIETLAQKDVL